MCSVLHSLRPASHQYARLEVTSRVNFQIWLGAGLNAAELDQIVVKLARHVLQYENSSIRKVVRRIEIAMKRTECTSWIKAKENVKPEHVTLSNSCTPLAK